MNNGLLNIGTTLTALRLVETHPREAAALTWQAVADLCGVHRVTLYSTLKAAKDLLGVSIVVTGSGLRVKSWGVLSKSKTLDDVST